MKFQKKKKTEKTLNTYTSKFLQNISEHKKKYEAKDADTHLMFTLIGSTPSGIMIAFCYYYLATNENKIFTEYFPMYSFTILVAYEQQGFFSYNTWCVDRDKDLPSPEAWVQNEYDYIFTQPLWHKVNF